MTLTSIDLTNMRAAIDSLLPDTCNILSLTATADNEGGFTESWGTATASVACRLDSTVGREDLAAAAMQDFHGWMLTVPSGTTITTAHRVEVGSNTFNVISVDDGKSWKLSIRCLLELV